MINEIARRVQSVFNISFCFQPKINNGYKKMVRHLNKFATSTSTANTAVENIDAPGPVTELGDKRGRAISSNRDNDACRSCPDDLGIWTYASRAKHVSNVHVWYKKEIIFAGVVSEKRLA